MLVCAPRSPDPQSPRPFGLFTPSSSAAPGILAPGARGVPHPRPPGGQPPPRKALLRRLPRRWHGSPSLGLQGETGLGRGLKTKGEEASGLPCCLCSWRWPLAVPPEKPPGTGSEETSSVPGNVDGVSLPRFETHGRDEGKFPPAGSEAPVLDPESFLSLKKK